MYKCNDCNKEFPTIYGISNHKRSHIIKERKSKIPYTCLNCTGEGFYNPASSTGKFCSNKCQMEYEWETIHLQNIINGLGKDTRMLRKYLLEQYGYYCFKCGISEWNNNQITLHVDHIDGNTANNNISNVRFLCPNCHSQTDTYCSKNKKNENRNKYQSIYQENNNV